MSKRQGAPQTVPEGTVSTVDSAGSRAPLGAACALTAPSPHLCLLPDLWQQEGGVNNAAGEHHNYTLAKTRSHTVRADRRSEPVGFSETSPPMPPSRGLGSSMAPERSSATREGGRFLHTSPQLSRAAADPKGHRKEKKSRPEQKVLLPQGSGDLLAAEEKSQLPPV